MGVAQISNLLYRRFLIGGLADRSGFPISGSNKLIKLQVENLRYSRLEVCATMFEIARICERFPKSQEGRWFHLRSSILHPPPLRLCLVALLLARSIFGPIQVTGFTRFRSRGLAPIPIV